MALSKTEFELKLVGPPSDVAKVPKLDFLLGRANSPGGWEKLTTTYYDSEDCRLKSQGLSLRIREAAGETLLSAKLSSGRGAFVRLEAERLIAAGDRSFSTWVSEIDRVIGPNTADLRPIARTVTDRWSVLAAVGGAIVEVSAETGLAERLGNDFSVAPIAEIELELLKGDPGALFSLAARFIEAADGRLRLSNETKLERALRGGGLERLQKAPRLRPPIDASTADLFSLAMKPIALRTIEASALAIATHDSSVARKLRVALRRFRALARLFRKELGDEFLADLETTARGYIRAVGAARDLDVFVENSLALTEIPAPLLAATEAARAEAWNSVAILLSSKKFGVFSLDLLRAALTEPWRMAAKKHFFAPARDLADELLERSWKRLLKAGAAVSFESPAALHPLRIKLKKFRYAAQCFGRVYDTERSGPYLAMLTDLQNSLGAINDAVVAQEIAERVSKDAGAEAMKAAGFIAGYRGAEALLLSKAIQETWRAFSSAAPFWRR